MHIKLEEVKTATVPDWSAAFNIAIAALPKARWLSGNNTQLSEKHTLELPSYPIHLPTTVVCPSQKLFDVVGNSTQITCGQPTAFEIPKGWTKKGWLGLDMYKCGWHFLDRADGDMSITDCCAVETPGHVVKMGEGVIGLKISGGKWSYCNGGVYVYNKNSDNTWIRGVQYIRGYDRFLHTKSSGIHVRDCMLENSTGGGDFPWMQFEGTDLDPKGWTGGQCSVSGTRFGLEGVAPRVAIQLGSNTPSSLIMAGMIIDNNYFNGGAYSEHAIRVTQPLQRSSITGNNMNNHKSHIMQIDCLEPQKMRDNYYVGNPFESGRQIAPVWSTGTPPKGWITL